MKTFRFLTLAGLLAMVSTNAYAQQQDEGQVALGLALMAASTGMGVLTGYSVWGGCRDCEKSAFNDQYFKERYVALSQDLALGAGESVLDLASATGVPPENIGKFGKLLREHRKELLELADPETITAESAQKLLARVHELAATAGLNKSEQLALVTAR